MIDGALRVCDSKGGHWWAVQVSNARERGADVGEWLAFARAVADENLALEALVQLGRLVEGGLIEWGDSPAEGAILDACQKLAKP